MKNTCPKCDTAYNVSAAVVGRKFTCKSCGTPLIVTAEGLDYRNVPPPPALPAEPPAAVGADNAFDFDAPAGDEEPKPGKYAKAAKPVKDRSDGEEEAPRKPKSRRSEDEPKVEDELDALPARKPKRKAGGDRSAIKDFLLFREFIAPMFVKLIFFFAIAGLVLIGLIGVVAGLLTGNLGTIAGALLTLVIGVPLGIFMTRVYCELVLLGFSMYDRLGEIKALLEKANPPAPPAPPAP